MSSNLIDCYQSLSGNIQQFEGTPCGGPTADNPYIRCCQPGNLCLPNHFCYFPNYLVGGSQLYVAGCNDAKHADPTACSTRCGNLPVTDVVYNATAGAWACCSGSVTGPRFCGDPTNQTFRDVAPAELFRAAGVPVPANGTLGPSDIATRPSSDVPKPTRRPTAPGTTVPDLPISTFSSTASDAPSRASSAPDASASASTVAPATTTTGTEATAGGAGQSTVSVGQAAGIGVGAGVGGLAVLAALAFLVWRLLLRRRRQRQGAHGGSLPTQELDGAKIREADGDSSFQPSALSAASKRSPTRTADGDRTRELDGHWIPEAAGNGSAPPTVSVLSPAGTGPPSPKLAPKQGSGPGSPGTVRHELP